MNGSAQSTLKTVKFISLTLMLLFTISPVANAHPDSNGNRSKIHPNVMILVFNPIIESAGGVRLTQLENWNDPFLLSKDYSRTLHTASHGYVHYQVIKTLVVDAYPLKSDGHVFTDQEYLNCLRDNTGPECPVMLDYAKMIQTYHVCELVNKKRLSEVWMWGGPWMGAWEAVQAGPHAIFTNGPPITIGTSCKHTVDIMGFSYERGLPEMLEDFAHRVEGNMNHVYGPTMSNTMNPWNRFTLLDRDAPGQGGCGTAHNAVNASPGVEYDRGNPRTVPSDCDDFLHYPHLKGNFTDVNCTVWNCTAGGYLVWWLQHLPHMKGKTHGKLNNWWAYVVHP